MADIRCMRVLLVTMVLGLSGCDEGVLRSENGLFAPVTGGKTLRFSGLAAALAAAGQTLSGGLRMRCKFSGEALAHETEATASGQDELSCSTPAATVPHQGLLAIWADNTILNGSIPVYYYGVFNIKPTVGLAQGLAELEIHVAGYPPLSADYQQHVTPACRFDAGHAQWFRFLRLPGSSSVSVLC